jgi:hypothetical protein
VLQKAINLEPGNVNKIVLACCYFHSYVLKHTRDSYLGGDILTIEDIGTGELRQGLGRSKFNLLPVKRGQFHDSSVQGKLMRDMFCEYFSGIGKVHWQGRVLQ